MMSKRHACSRGALAVILFLLGSRGLSAQTQPEDQAGRIEQLEQRVREQDQRIALLEQQVKGLLASRGQPPSESDGAVPGTPTAASVQAVPTAAASVTADTPAAPPKLAPENASRGIQFGGVHVGGDVYLFQYVPFGVPGSDPRFELYAFSAQLEGHHGNWGFYSDYRFRTTKLRSFFPGNTWLQQGYVSYTTPYGAVKAGSFYRRVGLFWDDSFFGNIQYFDGLKLDPEFGVGFEGSHRLAGRLGAEYSLQYFTTDAQVNGSLPGRDFVSEPGVRARNDVTARLAPVWHFTDQTSLTVGASAAEGAIDRPGGPNNERRQWAGDTTLQWRGLLLYGEVLDQKVSGLVTAAPQDATYSLLGVRWARGRFQPRFNYSAGNYHAFDQRREFILQPGITVKLADGFSFIDEFDFWRRTSVPSPLTIDRSLNFVLLYHF